MLCPQPMGKKQKMMKKNQKYTKHNIDTNDCAI